MLILLERKCFKKRSRNSGSGRFVASEWLCCSLLAAWICKIGGVPIHLHSYTVICQPDSDKVKGKPSQFYILPSIFLSKILF